MKGSASQILWRDEISNYQTSWQEQGGDANTDGEVLEKAPQRC